MENELQIQKKTDQIAIAPEDAMLAMIERVAANPDADIAKMERLMDMRDREFARIAEQAFAKDYVVMKPELPVVLKTKYNEQTKSKYATLDDVNKEIDPVLSKYGFATSTKILAQTDKDVTVEAILLHRDGHKDSTKLTLPMDNAGIKGTVNKTGVHATASSVTYARRYTLCTLLNISTGNDTDGNRDQVEPDFITPEQLSEITMLLDTSGVDKIKFVRDYLKVEAINRLPASNYKKALNVLNQRIEANANS